VTNAEVRLPNRLSDIVRKKYDVVLVGKNLFDLGVIAGRLNLQIAVVIKRTIVFNIAIKQVAPGLGHRRNAPDFVSKLPQQASYDLLNHLLESPLISIPSVVECGNRSAIRFALLTCCDASH
jgi:hypothetical protein